MQNRYVGDIGDYVKYALLRYVTGTNKLGVVWYLYPNENNNDDGKHTRYLNEPDRWCHYDPNLFYELKDIVESGRRSVQEVKSRNIIPSAVYFDDMLCCKENALKKAYCADCSSKKEDCRACPSRKDRKSWRMAWFNRVLKELKPCNIVFVDPDNGFCSNENFRICQPSYWKRLPLEEAKSLADGRTAILYHHNSMFKGGHLKEIDYWLEKLPPQSMALYFNAYSCRTFFIVNSTEEIRNKIRSFAERWSKHIQVVNQMTFTKPLHEVKAMPPKIKVRARPRESGDINRNNQELIRRTTKPGNHSNQKIWILRCTEGNSNHEYGSNGCDFHERKCPLHQGGKPGLPID